MTDFDAHGLALDLLSSLDGKGVVDPPTQRWTDLGFDARAAPVGA